MQRERVTDRIFVFRSDHYAQVTAGVVVTSEGAVLIDTLLYPEETLRIKRYVEDGLGSKVQYVINTHFHADHTTGTCFFPDAQIVSHRLCKEMLDIRGRESLQRMKESAAEFQPVELVLPTVTFDDQLTLKIGHTNFVLRSSPGHSPDSIVCFIEEDEILFAADTVMPIPYFVDGNFVDFERSLSNLRNGSFENIVQGHGEIILRGEAPEKISSDLEYLSRLDDATRAALEQGRDNIEDLISLEQCGKSHVLLNGVVGQLHRSNVRALVEHYQASPTPAVEGLSNRIEEGNEVWHQKRLI